MAPTDPILTAIARLETKVDELTQRQSDHETRLRWITTAVLLAVGVLGGPNAVSLVTGGPS